MIKYLKCLNWKGFLIVLLLCMTGALVNENVTNFSEWLVIVILFGFPISICVLFIDKT